MLIFAHMCPYLRLFGMGGDGQRWAAMGGDGVLGVMIGCDGW
jgi:hypothetical protein